MNVKHRLAVGAAGVGVIAAVAGYVELGAKLGPSSRPDDSAYVARGQQLYMAACAPCHGARLEGQANWRERAKNGLLPAPPHDSSGHTWHHTDEILFNVTKFGVQEYAGADYRSAMPAFEGRLSDDDIWAVLSYIESSWPSEIRRRHDAINESGANPSQ